MIAIVVAIVLLVTAAIVLALSLISTFMTTVQRTTFFNLCANSSGINPTDTSNNVPQLGGIHRISSNSSIIFNNPEPDWHGCLPKTLSDDNGEKCVDRAVNPSSSDVCELSSNLPNNDRIFVHRTWLHL